jgi:hypothetical protein
MTIWGPIRTPLHHEQFFRDNVSGERIVRFDEEVDVATVVKMNSRAGRVLPDIDIYQRPLATESLRFVEDLRRRRITPDGFQARIRTLHERIDLRDELGSWIDRAIAERKDQVLNQNTLPDVAHTLQLLYLEPREVHPPHCHHNLISTQVLLRGRVYAREYDRVARIDDDTILLRLRTDRWLEPGDTMQTTEIDRNAHWFAADHEPAVMLNFYILGYQDWTFDPKGSRNKGRRMLDPTLAAQGDGLILGKEIPLEEGYVRFGNKPIEDFPVPTPIPATA